MKLEQYKIERLQELKSWLNKENEQLLELIKLAEIKNKWFTQENIWLSIEAIKTAYLDEDKLKGWFEKYKCKEVSKSIGIILAGNIPMVGFHDLLCAFVLNAPTKIKLASKDEVLMKYMVQKLIDLDITWKAEFVDRLQDYEAVIATGSDNTNRYFEQYFKKVPRILRKNRNSLAVLNGKESEEQLDLLAHDIFQYFGLGCRNVSKIFLPKDYDVTQLFPHFDNFKEYINHNLYKDNYDYNRTLLLMNLEEHLANDFVMIKEDQSLHSRLATVHYSFYEKEQEVQDYIIENNERIQVVVGNPSEYWTSVPFGKAQQPALSDYADNVDTMQFLLSL